MSLGSEVVKDVTNPIRGYIELAAVLIVGAAFAWFVWHERQVGAQSIKAADERAAAAAKRQADAETALNVEKAQKADLGANHDEGVIKAYHAANPPEPIRLCYSNNRPGGLPAKTAAHSGPTSGPVPRTGAVPAVPDGGQSEGPDIGPELDTIVRAAAELAIANRDWQQR